MRLVPVIAVVPLKVTVPLPALNVPELFQLPPTFILAFGAVRLPVMTIFLNVLMVAPLITVVPLNVTVPLFALKAPELNQLPVTFMLALGAVKLPVILMLLNVSSLLPVMAVVPLNSTVPPLALKAPELVQLPATSISMLGAVNVPVILT